MYLTKSLFVEFCASPKLAWWHCNDKKTYGLIQEEMYGDMDGLAIGQSVEEMVKRIYPDRTIALIDTEKMRKDRHGTYYQRTMKVMEQATGVIYQPAFVREDLFVKCDFLVPGQDGKYDLVEVKAKNKIHKDSRSDGKVGGVISDLLADVSIQNYVLRRVLGDKFSGKCYIAHLNKEYIRHGEIDPTQLIKQELVSDELWPDTEIERILGLMRQAMTMDLETFTAKFPYDGSDYMTYYGKEPPARSIRSITRLGAEQRVKLLNIGKTDLASLEDEDIELLRNAKLEETPAYRYLQLRKKGEVVIDKEAIAHELETLVYPLYFYDYETISNPIPVFDGTCSRQQIVVQYSLHKVEADGTTTHFQGLLEPGAKTNEQLVNKMLTDMDDCRQGTRIVWYKGFENYRNAEIGKLFPDLAEKFQYINDHTFDLMEVFSKQLYFDRKFEGSASIKNVLPVLTDISYK